MVIKKYDYWQSFLNLKNVTSFISVHDLTYIDDRVSWADPEYWDRYRISEWYMCPENSYVRQFKVKIEDYAADHTALNSVRMKCFDNNNAEIR